MHMSKVPTQKEIVLKALQEHKFWLPTQYFLNLSPKISRFGHCIYKLRNEWYNIHTLSLSHKATKNSNAGVYWLYVLLDSKKKLTDLQADYIKFNYKKRAKKQNYLSSYL